MSLHTKDTKTHLDAAISVEVKHLVGRNAVHGVVGTLRQLLEGQEVRNATEHDVVRVLDGAHVDALERWDQRLVDLP